VQSPVPGTEALAVRVAPASEVQMFVRDFIHVARPFESVAPRFVADATWLTAIAEDATVNGRELSAVLRLDDADARLAAVPSGPVRCDSGPVRVRRDSLVVPLTITATGAGAAPELEADLEVSPLGPTLCQLTLNATYRRAGAAGTDDTLAQRAAEVVARAFLQAVAERITADEQPA
jgi:hypothetical protein